MGGMSNPTIRPKLVVNDADAAIDFYRTALDAELVSRFEADDRVVFAELALLGSRLTLKQEDDADPAPGTSGAPGQILDVVVADPDAVAARMIAGGASVVFEIADQPYGARGGRILDPFGVQWLLQTETTMTPEEFHSAAADLS